MKKWAPILAVILLMIGCGDRPGPTRARAEKDPKVKALEDRIAKTTPEGKEVVQKVQALKPEVNEKVSAKTLGEHVEEYSKNKGTYNITPIGWEASKKRNDRWKVMFHYQDYQKQLLSAEWEYNPGENKVYPFEFANAPQFYSDLPADQQGNKGKK